MSSSEDETTARKARRTRKRRYDNPEDHDDDDDDDFGTNNNNNKSSGSRPGPFEDSMMNTTDPSLSLDVGDGTGGSDDDDEENGTTTGRDATFHTASTNTTDDTNSPIPMTVCDDTIRIMVSTDNHLGYAERDPVRGMDSFAALEEVMYLAKHYQADMVLLGGDLFHDNKPSRHTLHTTMDILRRYTMGPNPIQIQIVSTPDATPFRMGQRHVVNYEDEHYSVDLPIFAIHGNHDDPTREGGAQGELLSAMDFLDVCNFVNYFGRQDEIAQVQVAPIMIQKGETSLALYGLGHMRDERLNRMWHGKKVQFLRPQPPSQASTNDEDENGHSRTPQEWFNLFVIHQNRDYGRGTKNCVNECMIPQWIDLVIWGHEHECLIEPQESVVGTFRISQPGSSVAISLSPGEAVTKQVAILDVRGSHFRMLPIPLTQVRTMLMDDISLNVSKDFRHLDPEDPKIEDKMAQNLHEKVEVMIHDSQETTQETLALASQKGNVLATQMLTYRASHTANDMTNDETKAGQKSRNKANDDDDFPLKNRLQKPNQPLIRLRVEHAGFPTINNQRFGAKFVGELANPSEILLFHRQRGGPAGGKKGGGGIKKEKTGSKKGGKGGEGGTEDGEGGPVELQIEDLVSEELHVADKKLELMDNDNLNGALEEYVAKQSARAFDEVMEDLLEKQQKTLIHKKQRQQVDSEDEEEEGDEEEEETPGKKKKKPSPTSKAKRKTTSTSSRAKKNRDDDDDVMEVDDDDEEDEPSPKARGGGRGSKRGAGTKTSSARSRKTANKSTLDDDDDLMEDDEEESTNRRSSPRSKRGGRAAGRPKYKDDGSDSFDDNEDDEVLEVDPPPKRSAKTSSRSRAAASSKSRVTYKVDNSDDDQDVVELSDDDDDMQTAPKRKPAARGPRGGGRAAGASKTAATSRVAKANSQRSSGLSQSQLSFAPAASQSQSERGARNKRTATSSRAKKRVYDDNDDVDEPSIKSRSYELDEGWGTAKTLTE